MTKAKITEKFSFKGWNFLTFLKGRKKLLVAAIGAGVTYAITQNAALAGVLGASAELLYAVLDYYLKE
ncbi:MAG: hypothetical protein WCV90_09085 [Candidatus Woesearchaeota archaeon]|jgi:hypothetical protein